MDSNGKAAGPSEPSEQRAQDGGTPEKKAETRKEGPGCAESPPNATLSALCTGKTEHASTSPDAKEVTAVASSGTLPPAGRKSKSRKAKEPGNQPLPPHHGSDKVPEGEVGSELHQESSIVKSSTVKRRKSKKFPGADARLDKGKIKPSETSPKGMADTSDTGRDADNNTAAAQTDVKTEGKTGEESERTIVTKSEADSELHQSSSIVKSSSVKRRNSKKFPGPDAQLDKGKIQSRETSPKDIADTSDSGRDAGIDREAGQTNVETQRKTDEKSGRTIETKADEDAVYETTKDQSKAVVKVVSPQLTTPKPNPKATADASISKSGRTGRSAKTSEERRRQSNYETEQRTLVVYSTLKDLVTTLKTDSVGPPEQMSLPLQKLRYHVAWVVGVAVVLAATVALLMWIRTGERPLVRNTCVSPACLDHARAFEDLLNYDVDPCVDFHSFVCSKGPANEAGSGRDAVSFMAHLIKRHRLQMVKLFLDGSTNFAASKMATDFLKKCTGAYKSPLNVNVLMHFFDTADVPWPFDPPSKPELHPLEAVLTLTLRFGVDTWFRAYINTVGKMASASNATSVFFIEPSSQASQWLDFVRTVGDRRHVYYEQVHRLYNASLPKESRRELTLSTEKGVLSILDAARAPGTVPRPAVTTIARLAATVRNVTVQHWLAAVKKAPRGRYTDNTTVVSVNDVRILRAVDKLLFTYNTDALWEHLSWWLVQILTVIGWPEGYVVIAGSQEAATVDLRVECYRVLADSFGLLVTSESAVSFFTRESRREVEAFLASLLVFLGGAVYKASWLDNGTKVAMEDRLSGVKVALWPPFVESSNSTLWRLYANFCITCDGGGGTPGGTIASHESLMYFMWWQAISTFWSMSFPKLDYMKLRWVGDALSAFLYEPVNNRLRVSHAALLSPLFSPASAELRPANYGGFGAAFLANVLRMYTVPDKEIDTDITAEPWSNFSSLAGNRARSLNCSIESLSNLRDVAGLAIAWQALKSTTSTSPGFDSVKTSAETGLMISDGDNKHYYSGDQFFFLTYCLSRCEEDLRLNRPRGPGCNVAVRGVPDFGSVFQCRQGAPMVPRDSCDITKLF